jgi:hypothetical protein
MRYSFLIFGLLFSVTINAGSITVPVFDEITLSEKEYKSFGFSVELLHKQKLVISGPKSIKEEKFAHATASIFKGGHFVASFPAIDAQNEAGEPQVILNINPEMVDSVELKLFYGNNTIYKFNIQPGSI